jgi:hypothetical protein
MKNKQKAWRLGAIVMGGRVRKNGKPAATLFGAALREDPGLQRRLQAKLLGTRGPRLEAQGYSGTYSHRGRSFEYNWALPSEFI